MILGLTKKSGTKLCAYVFHKHIRCFRNFTSMCFHTSNHAYIWFLRKQYKSVDNIAKHVKYKTVLRDFPHDIFCQADQALLVPPDRDAAAGSVRQTGSRQGQQDECLRRFSLQVITSPAGGLEL